jgi:hypothetical protein
MNPFCQPYQLIPGTTRNSYPAFAAIGEGCSIL